MFRAEEIRKDFPILSRLVNGRPLVYLDNAATTQIPLPVLEKVREHYATRNANVHRGIHTLSNESTRALEDARRTAARFIGAREDEVVFTSGTTDGLNMLAQAFREVLQPGDEIVVTAMEHHSNFVPWQQLCARTGAVFRVCPLARTGDIDPDALTELVSDRTRIVACAQVSNVLGIVNPLREIAETAHAAGAVFVVDGAQGARHGSTDVRTMGCDFYVFSGHKMTAPGGTGVLYGRREQFAKLVPPRFGGGMVDKVTAERTTFEPAPGGWEAGTPNYQGAVGLAAAMDYLTEIGREEIAAYEQHLIDLTEEVLSDVPGVRVLGEPEERVGCVSFTLEGIHSFDAAALLDKLGVAVRSGHHCAQPLLASLGLEHCVRVSPAFYNTENEITWFGEMLRQVCGLLRG